MNQDVLLLLLGRPGPLRMALEALLPSLTEVKVVQVAGDHAEALEFVRLYHPTLAIVAWVDDQMASGDAIGVACLLSVVEPGP